IGRITYSLGGTGDIVQPLNPLEQDRSYSHLALKNLFVGWTPPPPKAPGEPPPPPPPPPPPAKSIPVDVVNMMRFNRFISLTQDMSTGRSEAWLWDASINHKERLKFSENGSPGAFNKFAMLQTPQLNKLVHGVTQKIEGTNIIFRV